MKAILLVFLLAFSSAVLAQGKMGVGAMVGNPTGLNVKYWLADKNAVDGGMAFSVGNKTRFQLHSDYLFHSNGELVFNDKHPLDLYYGIGGRMKFDDDIELGVRLPIGLAHRLENESADVFGEIAPIVDFIGRVGLELSLAIGARYYF
ncbi:MAG: hypothetical protein V4598_03495 [Bdellovibrionota bacterium]